MQPVRRRRVGAVGELGARVEKAHPALAAARAKLVIAAHHDPGRRLEKRRGRLEEIRLPRAPIVAMRAVRAAFVAGRAGILAVVIIADMDHQVGLAAGGVLGDDRERPLSLVVAILRRTALDAAAGVAEHDDAVDRRRHGRHRDAADGECLCRERRRRAAHGDREIAVGGAALAGFDGLAVGDHHRASGDAGRHHDAHLQIVVGAELDPRPGDEVRQRRRPGRSGDGQGCKQSKDEPANLLHWTCAPAVERRRAATSAY